MEGRITVKRGSIMGGIIGGLFVAWILSWFGIDHVIIAGIAQLFRIHIGGAGYYVVFALAGFISELFAKRK